MLLYGGSESAMNVAMERENVDFSAKELLDALELRWRGWLVIFFIFGKLS
jgi:hypothetical protein